MLSACGLTAFADNVSDRIGNLNLFMCKPANVTIVLDQLAQDFGAQGSWSSWQDGAVSETGSRDVETRKVYRYKICHHPKRMSTDKILWECILTDALPLFA